MRNSIVRLGNITVVGLKSIARNKMRSLLTALGIVIGVACVIVSVAIGAGVAQSVSEMINSLGSNFIMVMPGTSTQSGARMFTGNSTLTEEDAEAIKREAPAVGYVSPNTRTAAQVIAGELNWSTSIQGVGVEWPNIRSWNIDEGSFFTEGDVRSGAKVAVLGKTVADNLFPSGRAVGALLRQRHRIPPGGDADFMMRSQEEMAQANAQQVGLMRNLLLGIAIVSLAVGGIGIMNIMLVSVTERTREIGIRMAIGARGRHVLLQFLFEAVTLSVLGGLLGVLFGVGVAKLIERVIKWPIVISPQAIIVAFVVAATIGIFFGFYPARKASKLDPIDALRYE